MNLSCLKESTASELINKLLDAHLIKKGEKLGEYIFIAFNIDI